MISLITILVHIRFTSSIECIELMCGITLNHSCRCSQSITTLKPIETHSAQIKPTTRPTSQSLTTILCMSTICEWLWLEWNSFPHPHVNFYFYHKYLLYVVLSAILSAVDEMRSKPEWSVIIIIVLSKINRGLISLQCFNDLIL